ncbi:MAG: CFI-box-CTERM domain-containing protein [Bacteroidota bacterium]
MGLIALSCKKCGASLQVDEESATYTCKYCKTVHELEYSNGATPTPQSLLVMAERSFSRSEYGKAMQYIEEGLSIEPHHGELLSLEQKTREKLASLTMQTGEQIGKVAEAEQYHLKAQFILAEVQACIKVYGSNSSYKIKNPANVDLALKYIERSIELCPKNAAYLNTKALLLMEGKGDKEAAALLLKKAHWLNPRDITVKNNLDIAKSKGGCFIATAAFGTPFASEVHVLRIWRDESLLQSSLGKTFVAMYYKISPPIAKFISTRIMLKRIVRWLLIPLIRTVAIMQTRNKP